MIDNLKYHYKTTLNEVTRWEILRRSQSESPDRYMKKSKYSPKDFRNVDFEDLFENDTFTWSTRVHGESNYIVTISFEGAFDLLKYALKSMRGKNRWKRITLQMVTKALSTALDTEDLYIDCSCPDFCLEENTQIKLLNNEVYTIKEIYNKFQNGEELWTYSTDENGDFKPGKITDVWISGQTSKLIEVTLDNDKIIKTTPNHLYMLRNGQYLAAENLQIGQSLMPLYFNCHNGYENVMLNSKPKSFVSVYKTVANEILSNEIEEAKVRSSEETIAIHHSDFNKLNNYPSNLKPMGVQEHWMYHCNHVKDNPELLNKWSKSGQDYWKTAEGRKRKSEEMKQTARKYWDSLSKEERKQRAAKYKMSEEGRKSISNKKKQYWANLDEETKKKHANKFNELVNKSGSAAKAVKEYWKNMTEEEYKAKCESISKRLKEHPVTLNDNMRKARSTNGKKSGPINICKHNMNRAYSIINKVVENNLEINKENYEKYRPQYYPHYETAVEMGCLDKYNHKIKSIRVIELDKPIDVYDLTIDKYNNFYVDAGVILHNCYRFKYWATQADCNFGTPQNRAPKVRNVNNNKGYCCKHILAILYGKRWVPSAAKAWLSYMQANPELTEYYIWGKAIVNNTNNEGNNNIDNDVS
jgi:intein/homing endonuclease